MNDPYIGFIIVLAIGIIAGIIFDRVAGPGWFARQFTGPRGYVTSALIGIAGAMTGYHLALLGAVSAGSLMLYVAAAIGAIIVLLGWRAIR